MTFLFLAAIGTASVLLLWIAMPETRPASTRAARQAAMPA
jgi:predicted MFS family arabinose efflux permease